MLISVWQQKIYIRTHNVSHFIHIHVRRDVMIYAHRSLPALSLHVVPHVQPHHVWHQGWLHLPHTERVHGRHAPGESTSRQVSFYFVRRSLALTHGFIALLPKKSFECLIKQKCLVASAGFLCCDKNANNVTFWFYASGGNTDVYDCRFVECSTRGRRGIGHVPRVLDYNAILGHACTLWRHDHNNTINMKTHAFLFLC